MRAATPDVGTRVFTLHEDRYFDADPGIRSIARTLYEGMRELPIVSPHGHVDARLLSDDAPFPEPTALLVTPDHYLLRMLHAQSVPLDALGVPPQDGGAYEADPRVVWQRFAAHYHLFLGTPSAAWLDYELHELFGVRRRLDAHSAAAIYDEISEKLRSPEFRPRALFERFRVEVLATTDGAADSLEHHARLRASGWSGRVIPTFRPDAVLQVASPGWRREVERLAEADGRRIESCEALVAALESRRRFFREHGATATDHGTRTPHTERLSPEEAERIFQAARRGEATLHDEQCFEAHMLMEMARMAVDDGLVMQLHAGVWRNHDTALHTRFGANLGGDIPVASEYTRSLHALLNAYGNDARFRLIVFTLDESTYARELAPLAGHYPAMRLGPPWWFHDSIDGMMRFRARTTSTAGIWNTAGFNDDTRAFCSIPARHDLARRVDANWLAGLVARHIIDLADARLMAEALTVGLARDAYRLGVPSASRDASRAGAFTT